MSRSELMQQRGGDESQVNKAISSNTASERSKSSIAAINAADDILIASTHCLVKTVTATNEPGS